MKRLFPFLILFFALPLSAQQWYFWIDKYHEAERPFLKESKRVMVVNNAVNQPADFGHSVVVDGVPTSQEEVALDNAALHCLFAAVQTMNESLELEQVELQEKSQNTSLDFYSRRPLPTNIAQQLCAQYEVEALLVLNQLVLYNIVESYPSKGTYFAYLQACAQAHWTVFHRNGRQHVFTTADTLFWESDLGYTRQEVLRQLPATQEALLYLAREVGASTAESLIGQWLPEKRYLYDYDNGVIKKGLKASQYQRWEDAIRLWSSVCDDANRKVAAVASANIAIAYELLGDYASACDYAQRAIRLFGAWKTAYGRQQQVNIRYYLEQLRDRQAKASAQ